MRHHSLKSLGLSAALALLAGAPAAGQRTQVYTAVPSEAIDLARRHGFTFTALPSTCRLDGPRLVHPGGLTECRFALFSTRDLARGWTMAPPEIEGDVTLDGPGGSGLKSGEFRIRYTSARRANRIVRKLILRGPAGADWRAAFASEAMATGPGRGRRGPFQPRTITADRLTMTGLGFQPRTVSTGKLTMTGVTSQ